MRNHCRRIQTLPQTVPRSADQKADQKFESAATLITYTFLRS